MRNVDDRIGVLDGFRGWGALLIASHHVLYNFHFRNSFLEGYLHKNDNLLPSFFYLSAFLLARRIRAERETHRNWRINFWIRRAFRILPLWWSLVIYLKLVYNLSTKVFFSHFFLTYGFYFYDKQYLQIIPSWSLFVEEWFYLLFPIFLPYFSNTMNILISVVGSFFISHFWMSNAASMGFPDTNNFVTRHILANVQYFFFGIATSYAYYEGSLKSWMTTLRENRNYVFLEIFCTFCFFSGCFSTYLPNEIIVPLFGLALLNSKGFLERFFLLRPFRWIGIRCYGFYILHDSVSRGLFIKTSYSELFEANSPWMDVYWYPLFLVLLCLVTEISWRFLELPFQHFGKRLIQRLSPTQETRYPVAGSLGQEISS